MSVPRDNGAGVSLQRNGPFVVRLLRGQVGRWPGAYWFWFGKLTVRLGGGRVLVFQRRGIFARRGVK